MGMRSGFKKKIADGIMKKGYFQNKLFGFEEKKEYHNTDAKFLSFLCLNQDIRKWVGQTSA